MSQFRGAAVLATLVLELGCSAQPVEPASAANAPPRAAPPPPRVDTAQWRPAVEGYVPAVRHGNQRPLGGAKWPFAKFLNQVHARIHPLFADRFLASLDSLPSSDPMNRPELLVVLEIVLESNGGRVERMGVIASSGAIAFDVSALDALYRAQPFGPPPVEIVSTDGFVYFHWEFHRGPEACGAWNARPYLLGTTPSSGAQEQG